MLPVKGLNHVGIAVRDLEAQISYYEDTLGALYEGLEAIPDQKVRVAYFRLGNVRLELLEPTDPTSPIAAFLAKRGEGLHHLAFTVDSLDDRIEELKMEGIRPLDRTFRVDPDDTRAAFLHPRCTSGVLTELCEPAAYGYVTE